MATAVPLQVEDGWFREDLLGDFGDVVPDADAIPLAAGSGDTSPMFDTAQREDSSQEPTPVPWLRTERV